MRSRNGTISQGKVEEEEETKASQSSDISSKLVRLVKVPTTDEVLGGFGDSASLPPRSPDGEDVSSWSTRDEKTEVLALGGDGGGHEEDTQALL